MIKQVNYKYNLNKIYYLILKLLKKYFLQHFLPFDQDDYKILKYL